MKKNAKKQPRQFCELIYIRPDTPILDGINTPKDIKLLDDDKLQTLCDEVRAFLMYSVPISGGHFGANLGVVELTVALHRVFDAPTDKLVWDVGHQAYAHKILTGRRDKLTSIRAKGGLTAFPERSESIYDTFGVGHSSTAISAALGMSLAGRLTGEQLHAVAVVGDGAMTGGMAFEAMNDAVEQNADLLVVLNDNDMSISNATGGFSRHLALLWQRGLAVDIDKNGKPIITKRTINSDDRRIRHYLHLANDALGDLSAKIPAKVAKKLAEGLPSPAAMARLPDKLAGKINDNVFPDNLFKAIGFAYFGPFDGHDVDKLVQVFERVKRLKGAVLVHIHTIKGKGFTLAEQDPITYHALGKLPKNTDVVAPAPPALKFSDVFGRFLLDKAQVDDRLVAITPAMAEGSGMTQFAKAYPKRFFDVAIAEQHAVTLAAGMATNTRIKPIVAIYSTFLQRGYDQLIHDVALQNLDVTFAIDRAGLVGEDGATHAGVFDIAFMRCVPNMVIATPSDENECYQLLNLCYDYQGVSAVRYPRGTGVGAVIKPLEQNKQNQSISIGRAHLKQSITLGTPSNTASIPKVALLCFGTIIHTVYQALKLIDTPSAVLKLYDMRFVKPLDNCLLDGFMNEGVGIITVEEHQLMGGAGSAVNEYLIQKTAELGTTLPKIYNIGIEDNFVGHSSHSEQLKECGLDAIGIAKKIQHFITQSA